MTQAVYRDSTDVTITVTNVDDAEAGDPLLDRIRSTTDGRIQPFGHTALPWVTTSGLRRG